MYLWDASKVLYIDYIDLVTNCNKVQCWLLFSVLMFHPIAMIHYCNSTCVTLPIRISTTNRWIPVSAHMPIKATKFSLNLRMAIPTAWIFQFSQLNVNDHPPASCFKILKWGYQSSLLGQTVIYPDRTVIVCWIPYWASMLTVCSRYFSADLVFPMMKLWAGRVYSNS